MSVTFLEPTVSTVEGVKNICVASPATAKTTNNKIITLIFFSIYKPQKIYFR